MEEKPNYFAVIPANVRYDEELKLGEKMMYGEITSLTQKTGECWASNNYFARLYNVSPQAISKWIKTLEKQKYITIFYEKQGKMIVKRIIKLVSTGVDRVSIGVDMGINTCLEGYQQEIKENNTSINNTSTNKKEIYKEKYGVYGRVRLTKEEYTRLVEEFGEDFIKRQIEKLDEYVESNNNKNKYTNFNLVLRKSIRENWFKEKDVPYWFDKKIEGEEISEEDMKELESFLHGNYE